MRAESIRPIYASGECEIDLARRELRVLGSPVPIGGRAFEVIEILARSAGELVTRDELMNRIWPGAVVPEQLRGSKQSPATNFPVIDTGLIGRSPAVRLLRDLVSAYRVVTLTGPG